MLPDSQISAGTALLPREATDRAANAGLQPSRCRSAEVTKGIRFCASEGAHPLSHSVPKLAGPRGHPPTKMAEGSLGHVPKDIILLAGEGAHSLSHSLPKLAAPSCTGFALRTQ